MTDRRPFRPVTPFALLAALALATGSAAAQPAAPAPAPAPPPEPEIPRGATVTDRARPEVDALGVRLGAFMVFPRVAVEGSWDDNVLASSTDQRSDWLTVVEPEVAARSLWSRHALEARAGARLGRHADVSDQDFDDLYLRANGRLDITRNAAVNGRAAISRLHEDAQSPELPEGSRALDYTLAEAGIGYRHTFNRLGTRVDAGFSSTRHHDDAADGIPAAERDRDILTLAGRADWRLGEDTSVFARLTGNWRDQPTTPGGGRPDRSSHGWQLDGGLAFDLTGVTFGEVFVGYRSQTYDSPFLDDVRGTSFGAEITNNFTRLTTFTLRADTTVQETTAAGASGAMRHSVGLGADHELRRNVLLRGSLSGQTFDYRGIDRSAQRIAAGAGITWLANRHLHFRADYTHTAHDESGIAGRQDWRRNVVMLRVQVNL